MIGAYRNFNADEFVRSFWSILCSRKARVSGETENGRPIYRLKLPRDEIWTPCAVKRNTPSPAGTRATAPRVCVSFPNWNGLADAPECLRSLQKVTVSPVVVIPAENASSRDDVRHLTDCFGDSIRISRKNKRNSDGDPPRARGSGRNYTFAVEMKPEFHSYLI